MNELKFNRDMSFEGRNGTFTCRALNLWVSQNEKGKRLWIEPITSRSAVGRCHIQVPLEQTVEVAEELLKLAKEEGGHQTDADLAREVYHLIILETESISVSNLGGDLAYLLGALLIKSFCIFAPQRKIVRLLKEKYPANHRIWQFAQVE